MVADEWIELVAPADTDTIYRDQANRIGITMIGSQLRFDINGVTVATATDDTLSSGSAGLYMENFDDPVTVYFDNTEIGNADE